MYLVKHSCPMKNKIAKYKVDSLPIYCDYSCKYADFTSPETVGACRRDLAVWCRILEKFNNKNAKCLVRKKN